MGYSVAAGIGAKIAKRNNTVISCIGDGSFLVNLQELQFIKEKLGGPQTREYKGKFIENTKGSGLRMCVLRLQ